MILDKQYLNAGILILNNVFSKKQYKSIMKELENIRKSNVLLTPEFTSSATYPDGSFKKNNLAIFLDDLYTQEGRKISNIIKNLEIVFFNENIIENYCSLNPVCSTIKNVNNYSTLINYYEDGGKYEYHRDYSAFTILSFFHKSPKKFDGGDLFLRLNDQEIKIDFENNSSVIFPSIYEHMVSPVSIKKSKSEGFGRYSISQFLSING